MASVWISSAVGVAQLLALVFYLGKLVGQVDGLTKAMTDLAARVDRLEGAFMGNFR